VKNLPASAGGEVKSVRGHPSLDDWKEVTYNPFKYESFVLANTKSPVKESNRVVLAKDTAWIPPIETEEPNRIPTSN